MEKDSEKINVLLSDDPRERQRQIDKDVEEYLKKGNVIQKNYRKQPEVEKLSDRQKRGLNVL